MNLAQLADLICRQTKCTGSDDIRFAKDVLQRRYAEIWRAALWKDSLVMCDVAVTPGSNPKHAVGIVNIPRMIAHVVAIRDATRALLPARADSFFRSPYDAFANSGTPLQFMLLPPIVWQSLTGRTLTVVYDDDIADAMQPVRIEVRTSSDIIEQITLLESGAVTTSDGSAIVELLSATKDETKGAVTISDDAGGTVCAIAPVVTEAPIYQRVQLVQKPDQDLSLRILGKRPFRPLVHDNDVPQITGVENCLLAGGKHDLYEKDEQLDLKQMAIEEYSGLLKNLEAEQSLQQADQARFVPDPDDWDFETSAGSKFAPLG